MPALFIPVVLFSLVSARAWSYMLTNELTQTCPSPANPMLHSYHSVCKIGPQIFYNRAANQMPTQEGDSTLSTVNARHACLESINNRMGQFLIEFMPLRQTLLKEMQNDMYTKWTNYLVSLVNISERAKLRNENLGFCSEAAHATIAQSIWRQVHTGDRESIQLIEIIGTPHESGHNFAVYNAKIISDGDIPHGDIADLISRLEPLDPARPVVICDSWVDYHGPAHAWYNTYSKDSDAACESTQWRKIKSTDYSIPSLRDGVSSKERTYLKMKMIELISDIYLENNRTFKI